MRNGLIEDHTVSGRVSELAWQGRADAMASTSLQDTAAKAQARSMPDICLG